MNRKAYLIFSGVIFGLVACMHLVRAVFGLQAQVETWIVPFWLSWVGIVGAGILSIWAFLNVKETSAKS